MAKVSIIVPIYNVEQYLEECLDSIINQTLKDLEIICVNDGSTDSSLDILKRYEKQDKRIVILDGPNGGYGKGMNRGLDRATGEYIGIVEPDDYVKLEMFGELYEIAKEKDLDFVKADFYRFVNNEDGDLELTYEALSKTGVGYNEVINPFDRIEVFKFVLNTWSGIYKREFIEEYHIRHNETPGASFQDNGFWFKTFSQAKRVYFVNKPYYMNRRDNPNSSVHSKEKVFCMNDEYIMLRQFLRDNKSLEERFLGIYNFKRFGNYIFSYRRVGDEYKMLYLERFYEEFKEAYENNEIDESLFTAYGREQLSYILKGPLEFYYWDKYSAQAREKQKIINSLKKKLSKKDKEIDDLKASTSFKAGRALTWLPRKILK